MRNKNIPHTYTLTVNCFFLCLFCCITEGFFYLFSFFCFVFETETRKRKNNKKFYSTQLNSIQLDSTPFKCP